MFYISTQSSRPSDILRQADDSANSFRYFAYKSNNFLPAGHFPSSPSQSRFPLEHALMHSFRFPDIDLLSASFAKFFRNSDGLHGGFPSLHHHHLASNDVITQQPMQPFGSQISTSSAGLPTFGRPPSLSPPSLPPQMMNMNSLNMNSMNHHHHSSQHGQQPMLPHPHTLGIPIQGLEILDSLAFFRIQDAGKAHLI